MCTHYHLSQPEPGLPKGLCIQNTWSEDLLRPKKGNCDSETPQKAFSILGIRKLKILHERICHIWLNISFNIVKWIFIWLYPLPFVKYHSPRQIASKKGNCELKYIKNASSILGKPKLKILHKRNCSVQLNSTFYCVRLIFIWLCPRQFVKYHPQRQFGACHIALNLAGIARPHNVISETVISKTAQLCYAQPPIENTLAEFLPLQCYTRLL
jgi:hypothetical protein